MLFHLCCPINIASDRYTLHSFYFAVVCTVLISELCWLITCYLFLCVLPVLSPIYVFTFRFIFPLCGPFFFLNWIPSFALYFIFHATVVYAVLVSILFSRLLSCLWMKYSKFVIYYSCCLSSPTQVFKSWFYVTFCVIIVISDHLQI